ncbi:hypothetical protein GCM10010978_18090 [Compostibacillus humi]|uniref:Uncharacterized protein n=1 Tax=Compostibacillus humi TaxID=1245525 RepID=A0A8J2XIC2_9BACI|nr:hypothetical protein GCM10010978_18090 [Compostibacillus humi]
MKIIGNNAMKKDMKTLLTTIKIKVNVLQHCILIEAFTDNKYFGTRIRPLKKIGLS